jgi:CubicO group peptidase (beta-lactamase class C family)
MSSEPYAGFAPTATVLCDAAPGAVGLDPAPIAEAVRRVRQHEAAPEGSRPLYAGAVAVMGYAGAIVARDASGHARRYENPTTELPREQWVPMREDTVFDLASVSKLFTSIAAVQLIEDGSIALEAPVAAYLPRFATNGKGTVTIRHLLTHTSGLRSWLPLYRCYQDKASPIQAVMDQPLSIAPGSTYRYSDLNLITLGVLVEEVMGQGLDAVVHRRITEPLGMSDTGYNPADRSRAAATEHQSTHSRGMVWGEVHDENAWSLGGIAGHAGLFSTAADMSVLAQSLLNGGTYGGARILSPQGVADLITNHNAGFPGDDHGLGFELDQRWYMDALSGPRTAGHTGYTGTSLVIDFASRSFAILLTNRVHPSRWWGSPNVARRQWARGLAGAMGVRRQQGDTAWLSDQHSAMTSTLSAALAVPAAGARLGFDLIVDPRRTHQLVLETSLGASASWTPLPFAVHDRGETQGADAAVSGSTARRWVQARASLGPGEQLLRWRVTSDHLHPGRAVLVDDVMVAGPGGVLLDGARTPEAFSADGWALVGREDVAYAHAPAS